MHEMEHPPPAENPPGTYQAPAPVGDRTLDVSEAETVRRLAEAGDPVAAKVMAEAVAAQRRAQPLLAIPPVVLDAEVHERKAFQLLIPEEGWGSPREARVAEAHAHATLALSLRKRDELELAFGFGYDAGRYGS